MDGESQAIPSELSSLGTLGEEAIRMDPGSWTAPFTSSVEELTHVEGVVTKDVVNIFS